jgi:hypothetical protein
MRSAEEQTIWGKCTTEWPSDYRMRDYCEKRQLTALRQLNADDGSSLFVPQGHNRSATDHAETLLGKTKETVKTALGEPTSRFDQLHDSLI